MITECDCIGQGIAPGIETSCNKTNGQCFCKPSQTNSQCFCKPSYSGSECEIHKVDGTIGNAYKFIYVHNPYFIIHIFLFNFIRFLHKIGKWQ